MRDSFLFHVDAISKVINHLSNTFAAAAAVDAVDIADDYDVDIEKSKKNSRK